MSGERIPRLNIYDLTEREGGDAYEIASVADC